MHRTLKRVYNLRSGRKMIFDDTTLIFFDLETTGFNSFHNNIIEIAAIDNNGNTFSKLVDPGIPIPKKITEITHITNEMVAYEPSIDEVLYEFVNFCKYDKYGKPRNMRKTYLIAHNCIGFDRIFLERKLAYCGIPSPGWKYIDTLYLAHYLLPDLRYHRLGNLAKYWNIVNTNAHRALSDVETMIKIWKLLIYMWKTTPGSVGFDPTGEDYLDVNVLHEFLTNFKKKR